MNMNINVLGIATTPFGELWNSSPRALAREAMTEALGDAKKSAKQIDALFVGNMLADVLGNQANLGSFFGEELGVSIPSFHLEGACASGGLALHAAINGIMAGQYETVMVLGVEKMTDCQPDEITSGLMAAGSDEERLAGATFPGIYALMARAYMQEYNISEELLASVAVKNHYHGSLNPKAQFQKPVSLETVLKSTRVADPIKLLECSPVSDGASAIVISRGPSTGSGLKRKKYVSIIASEVGTDTLALSDRESLTSLSAVVTASQKAYKKAKITAADVDVAEIHDCFSIAEVIANEDLGFSRRGKGAQDVADGKMTLGSKHVITNPSGGLKACGHPVGATGVKQIVEIVEQLRGTAGKRQVNNAKIGLTHNVGGSGAVTAIHILKKS
jgi:acetyl-CoA C-acetyltransferase